MFIEMFVYLNKYGKYTLSFPHCKELPIPNYPDASQWCILSLNPTDFSTCLPSPQHTVSHREHNFNLLKDASGPFSFQISF